MTWMISGVKMLSETNYKQRVFKTLKRTLSAISVSAYATCATAGVGYWTYKSELDAFTDSVNSFAVFHTGGYGEYVYARCRNSEFDLYLGVGEYIDSGSYAHALYRIDKGEIVDSYDWHLGTDGDAIFADDGFNIKVASDLAHGVSKAVFRVFDFRGTAHTMEINLKGSTKAIKRVMQDCKVGALPPQEPVDNDSNPASPTTNSAQSITSVVYNCNSIKNNAFLNFRVDRYSDNTLAGVQATTGRNDKYFSGDLATDGDGEITLKFGSARVYLDYTNMTARQEALLNHNRYSCQ